LNSNSESTLKVRLEIGAGKAPKAGYVHNDINPFDHIEYVCNAWEVPLPENSVFEILADGVVEHLTRAQARMLFKKVYQILVPGGLFHFTVPDIEVWCEYLFNYLKGKPTPFTIDHIKANFWGWQRWAGDEHKWGWSEGELKQELALVGFSRICISEWDSGDPGNAHLLCNAYKGVPSVSPLWTFPQAGAFKRILPIGVRLVLGFLPLWITRPLSNLIHSARALSLGARSRNFSLYVQQQSSKS
jgi:predicted SAM-dependent methyltransferase